MDIKTLASSSQGNCYLVSDGKTTVMLECGVKFADIRRGAGFDLSSVCGCLLTHEHKDHARSVVECLRATVPVYTSGGTVEALGLDAHHRLHVIEALKQFELGSFVVLPFAAQHDCAEPLSFLICSKATGEKLLFATDTYYVAHRFKGLTHIMIECNYALDILNRHVDAGLINEQMRKRVLKSHMSVDTCLGFLRANDLSAVQEIWLIHLSDGNSDEARFLTEVRRQTGLPVYVANK